MTVVCAGPGSGKTFGLASWLAGRTPGQSVAWLTLDRTDNDLRTFWSDVLGALGQSKALSPEMDLAGVAPGVGFGAAGALRIRLGLAELPTPVVLVLEDFHLLTDPAVLESMDRLLEILPGPLRLILTCRTDPVLKLHRLRMRGLLTEIRAPDLALTPAETAEVFERSGIGLSAEQLHVLQDHTRGWAAGVRLAAMSLNPRDLDAGIARFSGNVRSVAEYLVEEVLNGLSVDHRDFLLRTSVVERISGPLATELTGRQDAQRLLEELSAANALVVALGGQERHDWFEYHPLFRELLAHRLTLEAPGSVAALHLRAARWSAAHDEPLLGISQACLARDWDEIGRMIVSGAGVLLVTSDAAALVTALAPAAARAAMHPTWGTLLAAAACHYQLRDYPALRQDVSDLGQYLGALPDEVRVATEVFLALMEMGCDRAAGAPAALVTSASRALALLDSAPPALIPAGRAFRVIADNNRAVGTMWVGDLTAAITTFTVAEVRAREIHLDLTELNAQAHLALLDVLHGRLDLGHRRALAAHDALAERGWELEGQALGIYVGLGLTALARDRRDEAAGHIARGVALSARGQDGACRVALGAASIALSIATGDVRAATAGAARLHIELALLDEPASMVSQWGLAAEAEADVAAGAPQDALDRLGGQPATDTYQAGLHGMVRARAQLALDRPDLALDALTPLLAGRIRYLVSAVELRVLAAVAHQRMRRPAAAAAMFAAAVQCAEPEGVVGPFVHAPAEGAALLARYRQTGPPDQREFLNGLLETAGTVGARPGARTEVIQPLTEHELIVLGYLPTMLKAAEIASELFVSVHTVKAHSKAIYRKLGAVTRRQAVDRARALNLL